MMMMRILVISDLGRKTIIIVIIIRKLWFNWIDQTISSSPSSWWLWSLKLMTIMRMSILVKVVCPLSNLSIHEYVPHILRQNCLIPMKIPLIYSGQLIYAVLYGVTSAAYVLLTTLVAVFPYHSDDSDHLNWCFLALTILIWSASLLWKSKWWKWF